MNITDQIVASEKTLLKAIKDRDIASLDNLLHDDLLFNLPSGQTITKAADLDTHRSGLITIFTIEAKEQQINMIGDTAVVAVTINLKGKYIDHSIDGTFSYLRVWKNFNNQWKVIAGSCIELN
ncbi:nuclear transport factor 2 family protein [Pedobacter sp. Hv1]|uniref:nuclear transport factor 2 family protein n=1 Tax=Pedobacter sp. Hv1 TaxID=1740090 RepID=UPI0006D8984F|nr:nuclear transport factor 2 family protein [Pedobacter sp. Hv1]KQC00343.1 hypothetical protein AQF98_12710 [Pedobacter sp. Hv1]